MTNTPKLKEMLKLYSKKELWDRIQEKNKIIEELDHKIEILEKTLELACKYNIPDDEYTHITLRFGDTGIQVENWQELKEYALEQAEKELGGE